MIIHKRIARGGRPRVSLVLLDWSCRESFHALDWLGRQDIPRDAYEIIWIALRDRIVPEVLEKADVVATLGQKGLHRKHAGYNAGLLLAAGDVLTVCDSDAVFPPDFVRSIVESFRLGRPDGPRSLVLCHHEWRCRETYPAGLERFEDVHRYEWLDLWPNVGACLSVLREDAIRLGGFDEHPSFGGQVSGPYDLGWRLVNLGVPEVWHDAAVSLRHFAHPNPLGENFALWNGRWWEMLHPHVDGHALTAVEAFTSGRLLPLVENDEARRRRFSGQPHP